MNKFSLIYESKAPSINPNKFKELSVLLSEYEKVADGFIDGKYDDLSNLNPVQIKLVQGIILQKELLKKYGKRGFDKILKELPKDNLFGRKGKKVKESINESDDASKYTEVTDELKSLIEKTIEKSGGEFGTFVESFIKNPEEVKIEGFINESDIYDFYLKYCNQIDEVLNTVKFYQTTPEELNVFGLYDFIIKGTQKSVEEFVKMLKNN